MEHRSRMRISNQREQIYIRTALRAERSRIFYSLALAEYIELWAGADDRDVLSCDSEPKLGGKFRLECSQADGMTTSIIGTIKEYHPLSRIVFSWRHWIRGLEGESTVTIDILSRKACVVVIIAQTGLMHAVERIFFESLWRRSIMWLTTSFAKDIHQPLSVNQAYYVQYQQPDA